MFLSTCILAIGLLVAGAPADQRPPDNNGPVIGTVWRIEASQLVLGLPGDRFEMFDLVDDTMVMINGVEASLSEVQSGYLAVVMCEERNGRLVATLIDARLQPR